MLIVCPSCATSYMIDPASVGSNGRTVRCTRCKTSWFAPSQQPAAAVAAFVDDVIAEAEARSPTDAPAENTNQAPEQASPAGDHAKDEVAEFAAALDDVAAVAPLPKEEPAPESEAFAAPVAAADEPVAIADAPSLVPPEGHAPLPAAPIDTIEHEDIEGFAARRIRRQALRKKNRRSTRLPLIILALVGINTALVGWRTDVVRVVPQTASLFAAIGLPVNLRGLVFEDVKITKEAHDGVSVLVVEGRIVSLASKPAEVPRMRFAVRNAAGHEIYSWTAQPSRSILVPGDSLPFRSRLASPPADANDVLVRFFTHRDIALGAK